IERLPTWVFGGGITRGLTSPQLALLKTPVESSVHARDIMVWFGPWVPRAAKWIFPWTCSSSDQEASMLPLPPILPVQTKSADMLFGFLTTLDKAQSRKDGGRIMPNLSMTCWE